MRRKLIVCDLFTPNFLNNKLFDIEFISKFPGSAFWPQVHHFCDQQGWEIVTSDIFLSNESVFQNYDKYMISEMFTSLTDKLISKGVVPLITFSQESPNVALNYHKHLYKYTGMYRHAVLFEGLKNYVHPSTTFHSLYWPNNLADTVTKKVSWTDKKLLVMVASNKRRFDVAINRPFLSARRFLKKTYVSFVKATNTFFNFKDLYTKRAKAILHFSNVEGFALFGTLWDKPHGLSSKYYNAAMKLNPSRVENKYSLLSEYKFNLCFENCVFPGYVTEKIFDCFLAGTIPVYFGAPNIEKFVPSDCFLNYKGFDSFEKLEVTIKNMSEEEGQKYLDAASRFISSDYFQNFTTKNFAKLINGILAKEIV